MKEGSGKLQGALGLAPPQYKMIFE